MKLEEIRFLAKIMEESGLTGLEVSSQDGKIRLEKRPPAPVRSSGGHPGVRDGPENRGRPALQRD